MSILLGNISLAIGYGQAGLLAIRPGSSCWPPSGFLRTFGSGTGSPSIALLVMIVAAAYGVWLGYPTVWMVLGGVGGLIGWDLSDFSRRLGYAAPMDDTRTMERRHLERVGIVAALGLGLALLSIVLRFERLAFEVAVGLLILAVLGLTRLVIGLRK